MLRFRLKTQRDSSARDSYLVCAVLCARTENLPAPPPPLPTPPPPDEAAAMPPPSAGGASDMDAVDAAVATAAVLA